MSRLASVLLCCLLTALAGAARADTDFVITELLASGSALLDEDGEPSDWIEVHNLASLPRDLNGWSLTDDPADLGRWVFPKRVVPGGGFVIVFASGKDRRGAELHTNFRLDSGGEYLALVAPEGRLTSEFSPMYPEQRESLSYGNFMDVHESVLLTQGTPARYLVPTVADAALPWRGALNRGDMPRVDGAGFDDADWSEARVGLGYTTSGLAFALLAHWPFETSGGAPVSDGQVATGVVDETAGDPAGPFAGTASGGTYVRDAPSSLSGSEYSYRVVEGASVESFEVGMPRSIAELTLGDFTVQTWFKTTDAGRAILCGGCCDTGYFNFELHTDNRIRIATSFDGGGVDLNVPVTQFGVTSDGNWHHGAAVHRGDAFELYFDGHLVGSVEEPNGSFVQPSTTLYFGRDGRTETTRFDGLLDDFAFWTYALESEQIATLAAGVPAPEVFTYEAFTETDVEVALRGANSSVWLRVPFDVTDPEAFTVLQLAMRYSDGFVAYLNGVEVARGNAPELLTWNAQASASRSAVAAITPVKFEIPEPENLLFVGENVLAVHGLLSESTDADFLLAPELVGVARIARADDRRVFLSPSPGERNDGGFRGILEEPTFSVERGTYSEPFEVELWSASREVELRYTTDGSWPTLERGERYAGPIEISATTMLRAAALREGFLTGYHTQTYVFLDDVLSQPSDPPGFPSTWQPGWEADYGVDRRVVEHPLHADRMLPALLSLPTMSIVMDLEDLFNQPRGIYSNSEARGLLWERRASLEFFDPERPGRQFHVNAAIRSQGGATRNPGSSIKHSFRLIFKDTFGLEREPTHGPTKLRFPLFEDSPVDRFDTLVLRAGYNYSYLHGSWEQNRRAQYIRERFMRETQRDAGQLASHGNYVHLYLNGLYWGIYSPQERPDASFLAQHLGGDKEDYDSLNATTPTGGDWITAVAWDEAVRRAEADVSTPDGYASLLELVDLDNLLDYMVIHVWGGTTDWPDGPQGKNYWVGRRREEGAGWRFYIWDAEYSLQQVTDHRINVNDFNTPAYFYARLKGNEEYRVQLADRLHRHFFDGGILTPEKTIARYRLLADVIDRAITAESARWGDQRRPAQPYLRDPEWIAERDWMLETYLPQRTDVVLGQFARAGLYPDVVAPLFDTPSRRVPVGGLAVELKAPLGTVYYSLDGSDPREAGGDVSASALEAGRAETTALLAPGAQARLLVPSDGSLGLLWTAVDFDDQLWQDGLTGVGFGRDDFRAVIKTSVQTTMFDVSASIYIRIPFEVATPEAIDFLLLDMRYDDGYIAYINGEKVASRNAPENVAWDSSAAAGRLNSQALEPERVEIPLTAGLLRSGANVLAIHGLNRGAGNSDALFLPELTASGFQGGTIDLPNSRIVRARALEDRTWSALSERRFFGEASGLRVTELQYHPIDPQGSDRDGDDYEYLELQNVSERPLNLMGVRVRGGVEFSFPDDVPREMESGEVLVLVRNRAAFEDRYSVDAERIAGEYQGSLSNRGELLRLEDGLGRTLVEVEYSDDWFPESDGRGASLEAVDARQDTALWREAAGWRIGADTPGEHPLPMAPLSRGRQRPGDLDQNARVNIADAIFALEHLSDVSGLPCSSDVGNARVLDVNADAGFDLTDALHLLNYLFLRGAPPTLGIDCVEVAGCPDACQGRLP